MGLEADSLVEVCWPRVLADCVGVCELLECQYICMGVDAVELLYVQAEVVLSCEPQGTSTYGCLDIHLFCTEGIFDTVIEGFHIAQADDDGCVADPINASVGNNFDALAELAEGEEVW